MHLYWCFSSASGAPSVPENEADNTDMINSFQLEMSPPPTCLLARDLILSQFSIDCCENAFASGANCPGLRWGLTAPPDPQLENTGHKH